MASKKRKVAELNNIFSEYLERIGMREEAKQEFLSEANAMIGVEGFRSIWFEKTTTQLSQILQEIGERRPKIDLNEPAPEDDKVLVAVEDERTGDPHRKRKRVGSQHRSGTKVITSTAPRIHESEADLASGSGPRMPKPTNVRPFDKHKNQVTLILDSDSDDESD